MPLLNLKSERAMLDMCSSCRTATIRSWRRPSCWNSRSRAEVEDRDGVEGGWSWHEGARGLGLERRASGSSWAGIGEDAIFWRRQEVFVLPDLSVWCLEVNTGTAGHWRWSRWLACSYVASVFCLNCRFFFVKLNILRKFLSMNISFFGQKGFPTRSVPIQCCVDLKFCLHLRCLE